MSERTPKTFWGWATAIVVSVPASAVGVVNGVVNTTSKKGTFDEGFNKASTSMWNKATEVADEHSDKLTSVALSVTAAVIGGVLNDARHDMKHPTKKT